MNGLAPHSYSGRGNSRATKKLVIPADPEEGLEYMKNMIFYQKMLER